MLATRMLMIAGICACAVLGQSMNVDVDFAANSLGGGPASSFGGAAGQTGFWNLRDTSSGGALSDQNGVPTNATLFWTGGALWLASGVSNVTGDFEKLMGDASYAQATCDYTFSGLSPGKYRVYTYSCTTYNPALRTSVSVAGSSNPVQTSGGPIVAPNTFTLGITHTVHDVVTSTGVIVVHAVGVVASATVNGFQLVKCPTGFDAKLSQTSPANLMISLSCGKPGWHYLMGLSPVLGAFPYGSFFGIEYDAGILSFELAHGPPLFGTLNADGNAFGSFPGPIPSNLTLYAVGIEANADASMIMWTTPFTYTTL